jgi:putative flavoprotein involved in K+ transport
MLDVVVVGAGQAGLGASRELAVRGVDHVVLERGRIGETWRSQRWTSFVVNTPAWMNRLPGSAQVESDPDAFPTGSEFVGELERYRRSQGLPVFENAEVLEVELRSGAYAVRTATEIYEARNLIVATGIQNVPKIPKLAGRLTGSVDQLHTSGYRSPEALEPGGVLVVGGGQSGCQIAEELLEAGRRVFVATSRVGRLPRRYRSRDSLDWLCEIGFYDRSAESFDETERSAPIPIVTGVRGGHTLSLQQLARDGALLLGHLRDAKSTKVSLAADLAENIRFGDEFAAITRNSIDDYIEQQVIDAPSAVDDPVESPEPGLGVDPPRELDLHAEGITTVIWATGFGGEFNWLPAAVRDRTGLPAHSNGIGCSPGLYVLGFPWISKRKSGIIHGIAEDAARVATHLTSTNKAAHT